MKSTSLLKLALALLMLGLASLACKLTAGPPTIGDVVTAKGLTADYEPIDPTSTYTSDEVFYVSVEVVDLKVGSVVTVKYKVDGVPYKGGDTTITAKEEGSGHYGFKLSSVVGNHPSGKYTAEVYLDDKLAKTVSFTVKPSGPPSIGQVVTAKGLDADYKPVTPTTTYNPTDVFYVSVEVKNLVVGSIVEVKYKLDGEEYGDTQLTADSAGSGHYGFKLTAQDQHPSGTYTAEVYLDGKLVKTVTFKVK